MAEIVYLLCALTSLGCAGLLLRSFFQGRAALLMWSALGFLGLAAANSLLFVDKVLLGPEVDLTVPRLALSVVAMATLLVGFIREAK